MERYLTGKRGQSSSIRFAPSFSLPWNNQMECLKRSGCHALQSSLRNLEDAFQRFLPKQNNALRFSKRNLLQSYTTKIEKKNQLPEGSIKGNKIKLPNWAG
ncbi:hypothetical protein [Shimazuella alba]|uniref:Transposase n=1 Tax=Shimazuella alba TaxID=2690964 RepID=A0A6I4W0T5_9BACL|nr:hypothetical protein [Shimazuella alba]MXQ55815.1 hypothetical protein [Shimazuella alba]